MSHAPMGRFQLELIYFYYLFFHRRSSIVVFFPVGPSSLTRHSQQVLLGVEVSSVSVEETSTPNKTY